MAVHVFSFVVLLAKESLNFCIEIKAFRFGTPSFFLHNVNDSLNESHLFQILKHSQTYPAFLVTRTSKIQTRLAFSFFLFGLVD